MQRLAKAFLDIALWRQTPAHLPASLFLLGLAAAVAAAVEVYGALLPPASLDGILLRIMLNVGLPLAFAWAVLAVAKRPTRFLQTAIALLGVGVLAGVVLYPLNSLLQAVGEQRAASIPLAVLLCVGFIWYLLACAHIWRSALDSGLFLGGILSVAYFIISTVLAQQFLPRT